MEFGDLGQLRQGIPGVRCQGFIVQEQFQNVQSSRFVGQGDMKGPGHASLNGGINRLGLIGRTQHHDLGTLRRGNAVPQYQKFRLDRVEVLGGFAGVRLEEGVDFVNENNAGLQFVRQGKGGRNQLVGFTDLCRYKMIMMRVSERTRATRRQGTIIIATTAQWHNTCSIYTYPLVENLGKLEGNKDGFRFLGQGLGHHGLARS